jgi:hypothetical protein
VAASDLIVRSEVPFELGLLKQKVRPTYRPSEILVVKSTDSGAMSTLCRSLSEHRCHVFIGINNESECICHNCVWAFGIPHRQLLGACPWFASNVESNISQHRTPVT